MVKQREEYFDNLKGFLIILVIIGNSLESANPKSVDIHFFILLLYIFHMPLFVFLSGYFSRLSKRTTKEKVKTTLKIYVCAQIFYNLFNFFISGIESSNAGILLPNWALWYLLSMVFWYIISDYVSNYRRWIIGSIIYAMLAGLDSTIGTIGSASRTIFFLPFFIMGMAFKKEYITILKKNKLKLLIASIGTIGILWFINEETPVELLFEYTKYTWYFNRPWFPMFLRGFHYVSAIIVGSTIMALMPKKIYVLNKIGKRSLIMYLIHVAIIKILWNFGVVTYNSMLEVVLSTIIILVTVIVVTFGYVKIREKLTTKLR